VGVGLLGEPFSVTLVFALMCACAGIALVAWPGRDPARTN
jgi:drug/metabolite transporter (DMT)-like permease